MYMYTSLLLYYFSQVPFSKLMLCFQFYFPHHNTTAAMYHIISKYYMCAILLSALLANNITRESSKSTFDLLRMSTRLAASRMGAVSKPQAC